jgi:glyoxylase-like metal-dependent hydrolase (beta-lactamase superfamily II)
VFAALSIGGGNVMLEAVRVLTAGYCIGTEALARRGGAWRQRRYPATFCVLAHPHRGVALFDTGYSRHFLSETRRLPNLLYARVTPTIINEEDAAWRQLESSGIRPHDIRRIVVSHFHVDHIAGLRDFPKADVVCTRAAWHSVRHTRGLAALARGFVPGLLPMDVDHRVRFVDDLPLAALPPPLDRFGTARDLFGDGSALVVALPGHAVGQIGLFIPHSTGARFLIGDAAWSRKAIATGTPPPSLTTAILGETRAYRETLARLSALHRAWPDLDIVPSHDPALRDDDR